MLVLTNVFLFSSLVFSGGVNEAQKRYISFSLDESRIILNDTSTSHHSSSHNSLSISASKMFSQPDDSRARLLHTCTRQSHLHQSESGRGNLVHPIMMVCGRAGGSAAGSFSLHLRHQRCCCSWSPDGGVC